MEELRALFWLSTLNNFHLTAVYISGSCNTIADTVSRLHEQGNLLLFNSILHNRLPHVAVVNLALTDHMSVDSSVFLFSRCS